MHDFIKNMHSLWNIFDNCLDTRFSNSKHLQLCILGVRNELYYCKKPHRLKAIPTHSLYVIIGRFITELGSVRQDSLRNLLLFWSCVFLFFSGNEKKKKKAFLISSDITLKGKAYQWAKLKFVLQRVENILETCKKQNISTKNEVKLFPYKPCTHFSPRNRHTLKDKQNTGQQYRVVKKVTETKDKDCWTFVCWYILSFTLSLNFFSSWGLFIWYLRKDKKTCQWWTSDSD